MFEYKNHTCVKIPLKISLHSVNNHCLNIVMAGDVIVVYSIFRQQKFYENKPSKAHNNSNVIKDQKL